MTIGSLTQYTIGLKTFWVDFSLSFPLIPFVCYFEAERRFFKGLRGKLLRSLKLWLKIFLCD